MISVIIANYNGERYLDECLGSLINQSCSDFEVVVVDDCPTDGSMEIIRKYSEELNLVISSNEINKGAAESRNIAVNLSRGRWISVLDSDDVYATTKIEEVYDAISQFQDDVVLITSNHSTIDSNSTFIATYKYSNASKKLKDALQKFKAFPAHTSVVFRRDIFEKQGGYNTSFVPAEDYDLISRVANEGNIFHIEKELILYRVHSSGISYKLFNNLTQYEHAILSNLCNFHHRSYNSDLILAVKRSFKLNRFIIEQDMKVGLRSEYRRIIKSPIVFLGIMLRRFGLLNDLRYRAIMSVIRK